MFQCTIAESIVVKRYKCHWIKYNGIRQNVYRRRILHGETLAEVRAKAIKTYGELPQLITRI